MDPLTMMLIGGGLNLGGDLLGSMMNSTVGSPDDVTNLNKANTDAQRQQLQQLLNNYQSQMDAYSNQAGNVYTNLNNQGTQAAGTGMQNYNAANQSLMQALGQMSGVQGNLNTLNNTFANREAYDPTGSQDIFNQRVGDYQNLANQNRQQALSGFETPAVTQALLNADANTSAVANSFANTGAATSGAAAGALAQGAQSPLAQLAVDRANLGNAAYQNTLNPLLQQGQQLAQAENQNVYNQGTQNLLQQLNALGALSNALQGQAGSANQAASNATNLYGTGTGAQQAAGSGYAGQSALMANLGSNALNGLNTLAAPEWYSPAVQQGSNPFNTAMNGALQGGMLMDYMGTSGSTGTKSPYYGFEYPIK